MTGIVGLSIGSYLIDKLRDGFFKKKKDCTNRYLHVGDIVSVDKSAVCVQKEAISFMGISNV